MTNRASEGAIEKKLNTEKVSPASPAVPEARTALEESAASKISTTFHPEKVSILGSPELMVISLSNKKSKLIRDS